MPQMDSATYLGQVTWFVLVFGVFYLVMVTDVLPSLDRVMKMRVKKLALTRGDARQFDQERASADEGYGKGLAGAAASSLGLLMACQEVQSAWAANAVSELRQGASSPRAEANAECVEAMLETSASSMALASLMEDVDFTDEEVRSDEERSWMDVDTDEAA